MSEAGILAAATEAIVAADEDKAVEIAKEAVLVGGAVLTHHWADKIGADAYAEDAQKAVTKARELTEFAAGPAAVTGRS